MKVLSTNKAKYRNAQNVRHVQRRGHVSASHKNWRIRFMATRSLPCKLYIVVIIKVALLFTSWSWPRLLCFPDHGTHHDSRHGSMFKSWFWFLLWSIYHSPFNMIRHGLVWNKFAITHMWTVQCRCGCTKSVVCSSVEGVIEDANCYRYCCTYGTWDRDCKGHWRSDKSEI